MLSFSLIIIGDEILSGHRQDKHFAHILEAFKQRGLRLSQVQYVGDEPERIASVMRAALSSGDVVFSCGGIGATPDDHTRQAVAEALGVELVLHPEAERLITERCIERGEPDMTTQANQNRLNMGRFPANSQIIPNPYNKIPGFSVAGISLGSDNSIGYLYCLPGFPVMAWPMLDWVLDTHYRHVFNSSVQITQAILVFDLLESAIIPLMERIETEFSPIKAYSLPSMGGDTTLHGGKSHIELGCKAPYGNDLLLKQAMNLLNTTVTELGGKIKVM